MALGYAISMAFDPSYFFIIMSISIIFSMSYILISYYNSDKIAIASVGAKKATETEYKEYHSLVEGLCIASGMPKPRLYIMDSTQIKRVRIGKKS